jgi:hypothetical protein
MRITNVKEVEQKIISGGEPEFTKSDMSISRALNWYSYYKDYKDSKKYLIAYMSKNEYSKTDIEKITSKVPDSFISNTGFVCRILERGAKLDDKQLTWINTKIENLLVMADKPKDEDDEDTKPKVNIQDRIQEQTNEMVGELEGFVDNYKESFNPYEWMNSNGVKSVHARKISSWFTKQLKEPLLVQSGKADEDTKEAYSHLSKTDMKKYVSFIHAIVADAERIINNSKVTRKPRAKKKKPADKLITKLQYKKEDSEYKLVSINPTEIIGAKQLWVFNTKTRKLGVYHAWTQEGLTVKGTSIYGFTDTSCSKTLRKPADIFLAMQKGTERKYKSIYDGIKATEQDLTGRLNTDTILLKVFK